MPTIFLAMVVARCRSLEAPVEISPSISSSAARPPRRATISSSMYRLDRYERSSLRQADGHAAGLSPGNDGDLMHRVLARQVVHHYGVAGLMEGRELTLLLRDDPAVLSGPAITLMMDS